ncbi:MAG: prepilin-type N-terminal cleavage/methylation domain-containing protein [Lachnospiraceae bacterium]
MKKMNNKGFSMVELIIVIAIMAILAAALAPALIKYINKSRLSTDVSTGTSIASAIQTALSNESAFDACHDVSLATFGGPTSANPFSGAMASEVASTIDPAKCKVKSKKDMNGSQFTSSAFLVTCNPTSNTVEVYVGDANHMCSPTVVKSLTEKD